MIQLTLTQKYLICFSLLFLQAKKSPIQPRAEKDNNFGNINNLSSDMTKICQGVVDRGQKLTTTENKMADLSLKIKNYQENCAKLNKKTKQIF